MLGIEPRTVTWQASALPTVLVSLPLAFLSEHIPSIGVAGSCGPHGALLGLKEPCGVLGIVPGLAALLTASSCWLPCAAPQRRLVCHRVSAHVGAGVCQEPALPAVASALCLRSHREPVPEDCSSLFRLLEFSALLLFK